MPDDLGDWPMPDDLGEGPLPDLNEGPLPDLEPFELPDIEGEFPPDGERAPQCWQGRAGQRERVTVVLCETTNFFRGDSHAKKMDTGTEGPAICLNSRLGALEPVQWAKDTGGQACVVTEPRAGLNPRPAGGPRGPASAGQGTGKTRGVRGSPRNR